MSRMLSALLRAPEPQFSHDIATLERASGLPSVDVRLQAEVNGSRMNALKSLALDPNDTTGRELHAALVDRVRATDTELRQTLGLQDDATHRAIVETLIGFATELAVPRTVWVIRKSVGRSLLKARPPKKTMSALGYRSLDSMLKKEDPGLLFLVVRLVESQTWQKAFLADYKKLTPSDFEQRDLRYVALPESIASRQLIVRAKEVGYVGIQIPQRPQNTGFALATLLFMLHSAAELRVFASYAKLHQVEGSFGKRYATMMQSDSLYVAQIMGRRIHWRVVFRHYAAYGDDLPEFFSPHIQSEDLQWRHAEQLLAEHLPSLAWWVSLSYVGHIDGPNIVSMNILDVASDAARGASFEQRSTVLFEEALWHELLGRYMTHRSLRDHVNAQIDHQSVPSVKHVSRTGESIL